MNKLKIALAGNPNVGKSVIFNQLTGESQHVGNWPGKTVEKFEGKLSFLGKEITIVDLPGTYSLSAYSQEEEITKNFIKEEKPDVVINIIDSTSLEQNLFLTTQLLELDTKVVIALNMVDIAKEKGKIIDHKKLSEILSVPVVPTIATQGKGIQELMITTINVAQQKKKQKRKKYPKDTNKRYALIHSIVEKSQKEIKTEKALTEKLDDILLHEHLGFIALLIIFGVMFFLIFGIGNTISEWMSTLINYFKESIPQEITTSAIFLFIWKSIIEGIIAGLIIAIPYLVPFYILLAVLEDSGYLPRIAFLTDGLMRKIGLHGKSFIPMFIGYGCSVPACLGCRIIESEEQQFLTAMLATMIPCAARSIIILGVIGAYLGFWWVIGIYILNIIAVFLLGFLLSKLIIKKPIGLIMNMPTYKTPDITAIIRRASLQLRQYIMVAFPIIIISTFVINTLDFFGLLQYISDLISPITTGLLGLPAILGITLIIGFLRKELIVITLAVLLGTENFGAALTPLQMIVFTLVSIFYIPCSATIATLAKEFGWKKTIFITIFEIVFAIAIGAIALRILPLFGIS